MWLMHLSIKYHPLKSLSTKAFEEQIGSKQIQTEGEKNNNIQAKRRYIDI